MGAMAAMRCISSGLMLDIMLVAILIISGVIFIPPAPASGCDRALKIIGVAPIHLPLLTGPAGKHVQSTTNV